MLHGNESIAHYKPSNIAIWMLMAFQGGFLNVGGFMACHRFVSHVTGYGTLVPVELATNGIFEALRVALVPLAFLFGAMVSGYLVDIRLKLHKRPRYYISFGLIFCVLAVICITGDQGFLGNFGEPLSLTRDYTLLTLLTFVCGVQNGTITTVSKSVIRTTHLSGITTDLGIGLMRVLFRTKIGAEVETESRANFMRMGIISFFLLGSLVGFEAFTLYQFNGFVLPLITSGTLAFVMIYLSSREQAGAAR
jgi:uncharacterized membrane protein YoaK (UPF0700 family)